MKMTFEWVLFFPIFFWFLFGKFTNAQGIITDFFLISFQLYIKFKKKKKKEKKQQKRKFIKIICYSGRETSIHLLFDFDVKDGRLYSKKLKKKKNIACHTQEFYIFVIKFNLIFFFFLISVSEFLVSMYVLVCMYLEFEQKSH